MKHPNAILLEKVYEQFLNGNFAEVLAPCADQMTFQVSGKSKLAGKYTKANFIEGFAMKLGEFSGGTFKLEVHDLLASDQHVAALTTESLIRSGKKIEFRTVHVWRFDAGKPVAWYLYPRDQYQFDATWN